MELIKIIFHILKSNWCNKMEVGMIKSDYVTVSELFEMRLAKSMD